MTVSTPQIINNFVRKKLLLLHFDFLFSRPKMEWNALVTMGVIHNIRYNIIITLTQMGSH